jgi:hypothetical protein
LSASISETPWRHRGALRGKVGVSVVSWWSWIHFVLIEEPSVPDGDYRRVKGVKKTAAAITRRCKAC